MPGSSIGWPPCAAPGRAGGGLRRGISIMVGASGPAGLGRSTTVGESEGCPDDSPGTSMMVGVSDGGRFRSEEESPLLEGLRTAAPPSPWSGGLPFGRPRPSSSMGYLSARARTVGGKLFDHQDLCTSPTRAIKRYANPPKYITLGLL